MLKTSYFTSPNTETEFFFVFPITNTNQVAFTLLKKKKKVFWTPEIRLNNVTFDKYILTKNNFFFLFIWHNNVYIMRYLRVVALNLITFMVHYKMNYSLARPVNYPHHLIPALLCYVCYKDLLHLVKDPHFNFHGVF